MKLIKLTRGLLAKVDDIDFEKLNQYNWCADKPKRRYVWYARRKSSKKHILMHRVILGLTDAKILVDHINMDGLDNRRCNLRIVSRSQSQKNTRPQRGRDIKGVYLIKRKGRKPIWRVSVWENGKHRKLGRDFHFDEREEAVELAKAYYERNNIRCTNAVLPKYSLNKTGERRRPEHWNKYKGISFWGGAWDVRKIIGGKRIYLGRYVDEADAIRAWKLNKKLYLDFQRFRK